MTSLTLFPLLPTEESHPGVRPAPVLTAEQVTQSLSNGSVHTIPSDLTRLVSDLRNLLAATEVAVIFLTADLEIRWATPAAKVYLGDAGVSDSLSHLPPPLGEHALIDVCRSVLESRESTSTEQRAKNGRRLRIKLSPYVNAAGALGGVVVSVTDETQKRRMERHIAQISEEERRRIGEDLHDMIASRLTAASMRLQNLRYSLNQQGTPVQAEDLDVIIDEVRRGAEETRLLSHALVPVPLYERSLAVALQTLAEEIDDLHDPHCTFEGSCTEPLPENQTTALHLYRIAYEAVYNAVKHGDPSEIRIRLDREGDSLVLAITDDGTGLSEEDSSEPGLGLHLMQYRSNLIGADLEFDRGPEGGAQVRCRWPLNQDLPTEEASCPP